MSAPSNIPPSRPRSPGAALNRIAEDVLCRNDRYAPKPSFDVDRFDKRGVEDPWLVGYANFCPPPEANPVMHAPITPDDIEAALAILRVGLASTPQHRLYVRARPDQLVDRGPLPDGAHVYEVLGDEHAPVEAWFTAPATQSERSPSLVAG